MEFNTQHVLVGDKVWIGNRHNERGHIEIVTGLTKTLIIVGKGGEFNRYKRAGGWQHASVMFRDRITGIATEAECEAAIKAANKRAREIEARENAKDASEAYQRKLAALFNLNANVEPSRFDSSNPYPDLATQKWTLHLHNLSEVQLRRIAKAIKFEEA